MTAAQEGLGQSPTPAIGGDPPASSPPAIAVPLRVVILGRGAQRSRPGDPGLNAGGGSSGADPSSDFASLSHLLPQGEKERPTATPMPFSTLCEYPERGRHVPSLLPLWEKVDRRASAETDEGYASHPLFRRSGMDPMESAMAFRLLRHRMTGARWMANASASRSPSPSAILQS